MTSAPTAAIPAPAADAPAASALALRVLLAIGGSTNGILHLTAIAGRLGIPVDLALRLDRDDLDVKAEDILVLKNIGPRGAPGMPEAGYLPIPRKLARA